jgi:hypothetical protein
MEAKILKGAILLAAAAFTFFNCSKNEEDQTIKTSTSISNLKSTSSWSRVFTDDFTNTGSWNNWTRTQRYDYNSNYCYYQSSNPSIATYDSRNVLVLTAYRKSSTENIWYSGHVKSNYSFTPGINEEYRVSASIKLIAKNGNSYISFANTYGMWPAFWTVNETTWPKNGEIDIMEGYSYNGYTRFTSNLFYGTNTCSTCNELGNTCENLYTLSSTTSDWHMYDEYWKNENGVITVTIKVDDIVVKEYTNSINGNLKLENFAAHNIILNLNVGSNSGIFTTSYINASTNTMMWVDYVTVDKRTL